MKRVAVILRGLLRTWDYCQLPSFEFYDSLADQVDYYATTWDFTYVNKSKFENSFAGRNLVKLLYTPPNEFYYNTTYIAQAWPTYNILPYVIENEIVEKYDAVVETRYDVLVQMQNGMLPPKPDPMTLYTNNIWKLAKDNNLGVDDMIWITSTDVLSIVSRRWNTDVTWPDLGPHVEIYNICRRNGINVFKTANMNCEIIRPNSYNIIPDPFKFYETKKLAKEWLPRQQFTVGDMILVKEKYDKVYTCITKHVSEELFDETNWQLLDKDWMLHTNQEKIDLCIKHDIPVENYSVSTARLAVIKS